MRIYRRKKRLKSEFPEAIIGPADAGSFPDDDAVIGSGDRQSPSERPMSGSHETRDDANCPDAPQVQLNLNVRGLPPSATVAINERSDKKAERAFEHREKGLGAKATVSRNTSIAKVVVLSTD